MIELQIDGKTVSVTEGSVVMHAAAVFGWRIVPGDIAYPLAKVTLAQAAPILPYLLLVLILILRPKGLLGTRED